MATLTAGGGGNTVSPWGATEVGVAGEARGEQKQPLDVLRLLDPAFVRGGGGGGGGGGGAARPAGATATGRDAGGGGGNPPLDPVALRAQLDRVGGLAREAHHRGPLGAALLPQLVSILRDAGATYLTLVLAPPADGPGPATVAACARALGNIVVDHDANRVRCLALGGVLPLVCALSATHGGTTAATASSSSSSSTTTTTTTATTTSSSHDTTTGTAPEDGSAASSEGASEEEELVARLQRNLSGALGNLVCDNPALQKAVREAGGVPVLELTALRGVSSSARIIAANAARCLEDTSLLATIGFWQVDNPASASTVDPGVVEVALEALHDMCDEPAHVDALKATGRKWPQSVVALGARLLDLSQSEAAQAEAKAKAEAEAEASSKKNHDPGAGAAAAAAAALVTAEAQLRCAAMLTKSYLLHGDDVYLLQRHPTTVAQLARLVQAYTAFCVHGRPAPYTDGDLETLGIYAAVLAGLCGDFAGCRRFQSVPGAVEALVACASAQLDRNKAVRSAGLSALRNLMLACHQQAREGDDGAAAQVTEAEERDGVRPFLPPGVFAEKFDLMAVAARACVHANRTCALLGVGMLRHLVGQTPGSKRMLTEMPQDPATRGGERLFDWLLTAFAGGGLARGNKGQCECARLVCVTVAKVDDEALGALVCEDAGGGGGEEEAATLAKRLDRITDCMLLLGSFADVTVNDEARRASVRFAAKTGRKPIAFAPREEAGDAGQGKRDR